MLTLEIEFLAGVCFAARGQWSDEPDWPPQADRLFSALVATWGARGERDDERTALEWLESQPAPELFASESSRRRVGISYVPPNDTAGSVGVLPELRGRQARMFPAAVPVVPRILLRWKSDPNSDVLARLSALAQDTSYFGHSASVVRCRFVTDDSVSIPAEAERHEAVRYVYAGRLDRLVAAYKAGRRPGIEDMGLRDSSEPEARKGGIFGSHWLVFEDDGGACPDIRATAVIGKRVRHALMSKYQEFGAQAPAFVSGHEPDSSPTKAPHLTVVPMADVGFENSEGRLLGFAVVLPRELESERIRARREWLEGIEVAPEVEDRWRRFDEAMEGLKELKLGELGVWRVSQVAEARRKSLQPARYCAASMRWASVTPVVLDRYPKAKDEALRAAEIEEILKSSCVNAGLPEPVSVRFGKHASVRGAPSSYPSGKAPGWTGWTLPGVLEKRMLTHVTLEFGETVAGPLLLGGGRFAGLGLFLPVRGGQQ